MELKSGGNEKTVKIVKPDWGRAAKSENESEEIIETDIMTNGGFGFATPENMEEWRKQGIRNTLCRIRNL